MASPLFVKASSSNAASTSAGSGAGGAGATGAGGGSTNLAIHPLPILNMSDHHTRTRLQKDRSSSSDDVCVYGILLGTQQGRDVELHNSFEFILTDSSTQSNPVVDHHLLKVRQDQFKQVFPTFEIMGWYSSGPEPNEHDMAVHKQLLAYNETLVFLKLSPSHLDQQPLTSSASNDTASSRRRGDDDLPLYAYETVIEVAGAEKTDAANSGAKGKGVENGTGVSGTEGDEDSMNVRWAPCGYRIETGEAERIAVDHASKPPESGTGEETSLIANLSTQYNAVKMLSDRVKAVAQYVALVQSGAFPKDHETLRQIRALVSSLPVVGMPELSEEIIEEYNDVLLTSYLSNITQQVTNLNELVDKFDLVQEPSGAQGSGPGLAALGPGGRRLPRIALGSSGGGGRGAETSAGLSPASPYFERSMGLGGPSGSSSNAMSY